MDALQERAAAEGSKKGKETVRLAGGHLSRVQGFGAHNALGIPSKIVGTPKHRMI